MLFQTRTVFIPLGTTATKHVPGADAFRQNISPKTILKLHEPVRDQVEMQVNALDDLLEPNHKARLIWDCIISMDTDPCFHHLKSAAFCPGRKGTNPEVLFALWLLAFTDNIVSSREIVDLTKRHDAYKWLRGGVPLNHDMLCSFRRLNPTVFEDLLCSCLAMMKSQGLLSDEDFAQDGTRVQAAAGRSSGRRKKTLEEHQKAAQQHLRDLQSNGGSNSKDLANRERAAQLSAAQDRKKRLDLALEEMEKAREIRRQTSRKKKEDIEKYVEATRVSPTDPECRIMKMGHGGYTLAYNVQVVTGVQSRIIYGVSVSNSSDQGQVPPMVAETLSKLKKNDSQKPLNWICDSAYSTKEDIEGCYEILPNCNTVFSYRDNKGSNPFKEKKTDGPGFKKWRKLLNTEEFKKTYSKRCSTVELSNARLKIGGLSRFDLVGLIKAKSQALLATIAHNISISIGVHKNGEGEIDFI